MKLKILFSILLVGTTISSEVTAQPPQSPNVAEVMSEMAKYELTKTKTESYITALDELSKMAKSNPKIFESLKDKGDDQDASLSELTKLIESNEPMTSVLKKNNLSPKDFIMIPGAFIQAQMMTSLPPDAVKAMGAMANPANIEFFKKEGPSLSPKFEATMKAWGDLME